MSDQTKKPAQPAPSSTPAETPNVATTGQSAAAPDPLEGAHKDSSGVWVNKDGVPLSESDAELARQRLTVKGEPRKQ